MRLQKYLASCGVASRRKCEEIILEGRVCINGLVVSEMGVKVNEGDTVTVDDKVVQPEAALRYILYHKPYGEVCTASDPEGRPTVLDKFKDMGVRLYPVGRLDFDSEGLLLLTNDGDLTQRMLHPSREVEKVYLARVRGVVSVEAIRMLRRGVLLDGRATSPASVRSIRQAGDETALLVSIHEGRNRQVRRMFDAVGCTVIALRRVQFGPLKLDGIARGEWRDLTAEELERVRRL